MPYGRFRRAAHGSTNTFPRPSANNTLERVLLDEVIWSAKYMYTLKQKGTYGNI